MFSSRKSPLLENKLLFAFELKRTPKVIPSGVMLDRVPKIQPIRIAAIPRIINKPSGIINLFLRYQGHLGNIMKFFIKM
jgi:hypothetical protein